LPERIFGIMANDTLLAVPFFTFMGLVLERSGMAEDLLDTVGQARAANEEQRALRDRANVALGFAALQAHEVKTTPFA